MLDLGRILPAEYDLILDALECYERRDASHIENLETIISVLPAPDDPELMDAFNHIKADLVRQAGKMKDEKKRRRERVTLLKAKIIMSQQSEAAERLGEAAYEKPTEESED